MTASFDLEQELLRCWGVTDDIELVYHSLESMTEDQRLNALLGLQTLYELKFEKAWKAFEAICAERKAMQERIVELEKEQK